MTVPEDPSKAGEFQLARFLPYRIVALGQGLGQLLSRQYADDFGITMPEWRTLALIGEHGQLTAADVVRRTPLDKVAVSRAASALAEKGLVVRTPHKEDGRAVTLSLTDKGREVYYEIGKRGLRVEGEVLAALSTSERQELLELLGKLEASVARLAAGSR
jgi:DNA-binding MarR family transcriptional regulator